MSEKKNKKSDLRSYYLTRTGMRFQVFKKMDSGIASLFSFDFLPISRLFIGKGLESWPRECSGSNETEFLKDDWLLELSPRN